MNKNERFSEIIEILNNTPYTTIERLAEELHISTSSIRRDVTALEARGLVRRTHGGVSLMVSDNLNIPFAMRAKANASEKKHIAKKAAALVREGDVVLLDTSSTDLYIAHELVKKRGITVVTNSVAILAFLSEFNTKVLCTGGILDSEDRNGLVGNEALCRISEVRANLAFIAPQAIDEDGNLFDCYHDNIPIVRQMLASADQKVGVCDSSKLGKASTYKQCSIGELDALIGEINLGPFYAQKFPNVKYY